MEPTHVLYREPNTLRFATEHHGLQGQQYMLILTPEEWRHLRHPESLELVVRPRT